MRPPKGFENRLVRPKPNARELVETPLSGLPFSRVVSGHTAEPACRSALGCQLDDNGSLACWGALLESEEYGPEPPPSGRFTQVSGGYDSACALRVGGHVACWGYNLWGEAHAPSGTFSLVTVGADFACELRTICRTNRTRPASPYWLWVTTVVTVWVDEDE